MSEVSKHGAELGAMNAELIKALQANREERRQERERISNPDMKGDASK